MASDYTKAFVGVNENFRTEIFKSASHQISKSPNLHQISKSPNLQIHGLTNH
jgi:hypothetical protein